MRAFIDLTGASGASYRFRRRQADAAHLPTAGNYVIVRETASDFKVLTIGLANDLSAVRPPGPGRPGRNASHLFTRLNVARAVRTQEHEDLVANYSSAEVLTDIG